MIQNEWEFTLKKYKKIVEVVQMGYTYHRLFEEDIYCRIEPLLQVVYIRIVNIWEVNICRWIGKRKNKLLKTYA